MNKIQTNKMLNFMDACKTAWLLTVMCYGLSTLDTIVADIGANLSPKMATVADLGDYSRQSVWTGL